MADTERSARTDPVLRELRREILRVFAGGKCPPREQIALHDCPECDALRRAFTGVGWRKVPDGLIEANPSCLPLLSPEGYHYFLPSYLLYALDHFTHDATPTAFLVYDLTPTKADEDSLDWVRERLRPFTREEIELAAAFVDLVAADESFRAHMREAETGSQPLLEQWEARWNS